MVVVLQQEPVQLILVLHEVMGGVTHVVHKIISISKVIPLVLEELHFIITLLRKVVGG